MNACQHAALKILTEAIKACMARECVLSAAAIQHSFQEEIKYEKYSDVFVACVAVELQSLGVL